MNAPGSAGVSPAGGPKGRFPQSRLPEGRLPRAGRFPSGRFGRSRRDARGIALFVCLALLLALTAGGLAAARAATLELRMARNHHDAAVALHAAEVALADAERWLETQTGDPARFPDADGLFRVAAYGADPHWRDANAWRGALVPPSIVPDVPTQPRYVVEWLTTVVDAPGAPEPPLTIDIFRITAIGEGMRARATLQSVYGRSRGASRRPLTERRSWAEVVR